MRDLSLHLMDIVRNSVRAEATKIDIVVAVKGEWIEICIKDNGRGMDETLLKSVTDPFTTSRKTRKIGLGIPLFEQTCSVADGKLEIESKVLKGTIVKGMLKINHIDRIPLGNVADTVVNCILSEDKIDFTVNFESNKGTFAFSTIEVKEQLDGVPIDHIDVINWIRTYLEDGMKEIFGGVLDEITC